MNHYMLTIAYNDFDLVHKEFTELVEIEKLSLVSIDDDEKIHRVPAADAKISTRKKQ